MRAATRSPTPEIARSAGASGPHHRSDLGPQLAHAAGDLADPGQELAADPDEDSLGPVAAEALGEATAGRLAIEGAAEGLKARVQVVEVPAQPHAVGGPLETRSSRWSTRSFSSRSLGLWEAIGRPGSRRAAPGNREGVDPI